MPRTMTVAMDVQVVLTVPVDEESPFSQNGETAEAFISDLRDRTEENPVACLDDLSDLVDEYGDNATVTFGDLQAHLSAS